MRHLSLFLSVTSICRVNLLKHFRAIATRYDKIARNFLAGVQLAAVTILLN
jgi:transposase